MTEKTISKEEFLRKFKFKPDMHMLYGVEDELFLYYLENGNLAPEADKALGYFGFDPRYSYEPCMCQFEYKVGPCRFEGIRNGILYEREMIRAGLKTLGLGIKHLPVAPENVPLDLYPDPKGRYQEIFSNMSHDEYLAAFRIAAVQFHIGMKSLESAIHHYNYVVSEHFDDLMEEAGSLCPERLDLYGVVKPIVRPPIFKSIDHFYKWHLENSYAENPRNNWMQIRITVHGSIEFRMFGAMEDVDKIMDIASEIQFYLTD